ncbi:type VII secretion target [Stackebrandtia soli]|uniref:type VII secretion target n=1 Tax=Stackebrandtia soli TaxID=1892856 RepID=UPI0039E84AD4
MTTVQIVAEELRTHAGSIDTCVGVVELAQGASNHIQLGNEAYGVLCQWIPPILQGRHDEMNTLLTHAKANLDTYSLLLRTAADNFETVDQINSWDLTMSSIPIEEGVEV